MTVSIQQFDFSVDLLRALLWQYNDAANLQALLQSKQNWYNANQQQFWQNWHDNVFNLQTANDFGLNVWAIILGQSIYVNTASDAGLKPAFGFGSNHVNFTRGNFASDHGQTYQLPTESARVLLQLRYFQLTSAGTVPELNRMLAFVFRNYGAAYVIDHLNMTMTYHFTFPLSQGLLYIFNNYDILPRPAGVKINFTYGNVLPFGFGPTHVNFTNGNFGV